MFLKKVYINDFKALKDVHISLEQNPKSNVFSIASLNGAGKSTLLQFIFVLLHASFDDTRKQYVKNMLEGLYELNSGDELIELAEFEIRHNKQNINIEFFISSNHLEKGSFGLFLDILEIKSKLKESYTLNESLGFVLGIQEEIHEFNRVSSISHKEIQRNIESLHEQKLYDAAKKTEDFLLLLDQMVSDRMSKIGKITGGSIEELEDLLEDTEQELLILNSYLKNINLSYALHLDSETVLLFRSNANKEQLNEISNKVFLAAPNTQVFLFLELEGRNSNSRLGNFTININYI